MVLYSVSNKKKKETRVWLQIAQNSKKMITKVYKIDFSAW